MRVLSYWIVVSGLDQFLLGMLADIYYRTYFVAGKRLDYVAIGRTGLLLMLLFGFNQLGGGRANNCLRIFWSKLEAMAWAIFLIGCLSIARHFHRLVGNFLVALGTISDSIYVGHFRCWTFPVARLGQSMVIRRSSRHGRTQYLRIYAPFRPAACGENLFLCGSSITAAQTQLYAGGEPFPAEPQISIN